MHAAHTHVPDALFPFQPHVAAWNVVCDFDGTITPFDVTDAVLERFALPEWEELEARWLEGRINARECMRGQIALIRAPRAELDAFLDTVPVDPAFPGFVRFCEARGLDLTVVSDGMDYAIRRVLGRHGLGRVPVIANRLVVRPDGYRLDFPFSDANCGSGVCKCRVADGLSGPDGNILLIGDGRSDCCLAARADFVLAKDNKELLRVCRDQDRAHLPYADFADIQALVAARLDILADVPEHSDLATDTPGRTWSAGPNLLPPAWRTA